MADGIMFCGYCGTRRVPGEAFCRNCGGRFEAAPAPPPMGWEPPPVLGGSVPVATPLVSPSAPATETQDWGPQGPTWAPPGLVPEAAPTSAQATSRPRRSYLIPSMLGCLLLIGLAAVGGYFGFRAWMNKGTPTIAEMGALAPASTRYFAAISMRPGAEDLKTIQEWKALLEENEEAREALKRLEANLGSSLDQLLTIAMPAGFVAVLPVSAPTDGPPAGLWAFRVRDEVAAREAIERWLLKAPPGVRLEPTRIADFDGWTVPGPGPGAVLTIARGYFIMGSPRSEVDGLIARISRPGEGLAANQEFTTALGRMGRDPEAFAWMDLKGTIQDLESNLGAAAPLLQRALEAFKDVRSVSIGVRRASGDWRTAAFLSLGSSPSTRLGRTAMQAPAAAGLDPATLVPADAEFYSSLDPQWSWNLVKEFATLQMGPDVAGQLSSRLGVDVERLVGSANGPVGCSTDIVSLLETSTASDALKPTVLYVVGLKDATAARQALGALGAQASRAGAQGRLTACRSNLKNIATACEMWSTDHLGRYPQDLSQLTPNYLSQVPTCPEGGPEGGAYLFWSTSNPDRYETTCASSHAVAGVAKGHPRYSSISGLEDGPVGGAPPPVVAPTPPTKETSYKGADVFGYDLSGASIRWTFLEQPSALVLAEGPRALEMVQRSLDTRESGQNLAGHASYKSLVGGSTEGILGTTFLETPALYEALLKWIASNVRSGQDEQPITSWLQKDAVRRLFTRPAVSVARVDQEGLLLESRGLGPPVLAPLAAAVLVPNFTRAQDQGQFTACKSNLKNIATALEMWSTDNSGRYPTSLSQLTEGQRYLRTLPTCPAAGRDTYSEYYRSASNPDRYTVICAGNNHNAVDAGRDFPQYNSVAGLIEKEGY